MIATSSAWQPQRLASLDQFRGYTVVGMIFVNFIGHFDFAKPTVWSHHNTYCSYADTIMPHFLFAVGFALRWTWAKRVAEQGYGPAVSRVFWRCLGLFMLGTLVYGIDRSFKSWPELAAAWRSEGPIRLIASCFERNPFQTLLHIAVTSLFVLPVLGMGTWPRVFWALAALGVHAWVSLKMGYFDFSWKRPVIDGGPLGFLTWTTPTIVGTLAADAVRASGVAGAGRLALGGLALMLVGYAINCPTVWYRNPPPEGVLGYFTEPPFVPPDVRKPSNKFPERPDAPEQQNNYWQMSQRAGTPAYLVFSAGFSLFVYAGFLLACDGWGWNLPLFRTFGSNALVAYLLHGILGEPFQKFTPGDAPLWAGSLAFALAFASTWLFVRQLEKQKIFVRM